MAVIRSGASSTDLTVDTASLAARVAIYDTAGNALGNRSTYMAASTFTPAATATDVVTIIGSASKIIRVYSIKFSTTVTTAGNLNILVIKRSTADTTGTFVAATAVPLDANNAAATTTVGHYTANPGALGTAVGTIVQVRQAVGIVTASTGVFDTGIDLLQANALRGDQPVVLRAAAQQLAVNLNSVALIAGQTHAWQIIWSEDTV